MKISVATSVYNQEQQISAFLDAALKFADEIIIVDHFSTDLTKKICMSYKKVHFIERNLESTDAVRKLAMSLCTGDYNIFLDIQDFKDELANREMLSICSVSNAFKISLQNS